MSLEVRPWLAPSRDPCSPRSPSSQTSSRPHHDRSFPLLRLPHELLDVIFEDAYEDDAHPKPICRALRAFAEKRCFRDVVLENYPSFARFCSTMERSPRLAPLVRTLKFDYRYCEAPNSRVVRTTRSGAVSGRIVDLQDFRGLLEKLGNLLSLRVIDLDPDLTQVLTCGHLGPSSLPKLRNFSLVQEKISQVDEEAWAAQLARLSSLVSLDLRIFDRPVPLPRLKQYPNIRALAVSGCHFDSWPAFDFSAAFPNLTAFKAHERDGVSVFRRIVETLPQSLDFLHLTNKPFGDYRSPLPQPIDDLLPEFVQVDDLYLGSGTFTLPRLNAYLATDPFLVAIGFGLEAPITDDFLLQLLDPETGALYLEELTLDHVDCVRGTTMASQGYKLSPDAAETLWHTYPEWFGPVWPAGCSQEGLRKVLHKAAEAEIKVEGSALEVFAWEDEYSGEVYDALMSWGLEHGDFAEARDMFGDAAVDSFLDSIFGDDFSDW